MREVAQTARAKLGERLAKGTSELLTLPLSFTGLAFFRAWVSLLTDGALVSNASGALHDALMAMALVVVALFSARHPKPFALSPTWIAVAAVTALSASSIGIASHTPGTVWSAAPSIAGAPASCLFIILWCELYSYVDPGRAAASLCLSIMGAEALLLVLNDMSAAGRSAALFILPVISALCYLRARSLTMHSRTGIAQRCPSEGRVRIPWKLLVIVGLYYLASGACLGVAGNVTWGVDIVAKVAASLALLACVVYFPDRFDLGTTLRSPIPLFVCAMLLLPFAGGMQGSLAAGLTALGLELFELVVFLTLCDISRSCAIPAVLLFGLEEALVILRSVGSLATSATSPLVVAGFGPIPLALAAVALAAIATFVLLDRTELASGWRVGLFGPGRITLEEDPQGTLRELTLKARADFGLSPRETDVLLAILRGADVDEACQELSIAKGTFKAHCEHIYKKVGVRSRKELVKRLLL